VTKEGYLGIGGKYYIGTPKQLTITVCRLVNNEYQKVLLRKGDRIQSTLFPNFDLLTDKLFDLG
jgi:Uma2 family endonuclease